MRPLALLVVLVLLAPGVAQAGATPDLVQRMSAMAPGDRIAVIARFRERVPAARFGAGREGAPALITDLRATAARSQAGARELLRSRGLAGAARELWIDNSLALEATPELVDELAALPEVGTVEFDEPVVAAIGAPTFDPEAIAAYSPVWSLIKIRVPQVWSQLGLDGTGVLLGSMDTGFDPAHPALAGKWRGGSNSWRDVINGLPSPYDDHGHGTHTIGTMLGGDAGGPFATDIGVAPGAQFISAKVLDATNSFSSASIVITGAQWMLDPDGNAGTNDFPQIVSNSWYFFSGTYTGYHATMQAWRAAGIIPVFCIANNGPAASTTNPPGNYNNVIGVASTDSFDVISSFSSRGPAPVGSVFPADRRKPDLAAPGSAVTSSVPGGGYQAWFGTSMATPAVAGTIALMKQARPGLTYDDARTALITSAVDLGAAGYDYDYGYGRLDALAAVLAATANVPPSVGAAAAGLGVRPNPAHGAVTFALGESAGPDASVDVLDLQGRRVWSTRGAAEDVTWDGRDARGVQVPNGVYLVQARIGAEVRTGRVLQLR